MFNFSVFTQNFRADRFSLKLYHVYSTTDLLVIPMCGDAMCPANYMI